MTAVLGALVSTPSFPLPSLPLISPHLPSLPLLQVMTLMQLGLIANPQDETSNGNGLAVPVRGDGLRGAFRLA